MLALALTPLLQISVARIEMDELIRLALTMLPTDIPLAHTSLPRMERSELIRLTVHVEPSPCTSLDDTPLVHVPVTDRVSMLAALAMTRPVLSYEIEQPEPCVIV